MLLIKKIEGSDLPALMNYIETDWKAGHIMAHDVELMNFQHGNPDGSYNFAIVKRDDAVSGILGYIPLSHFDNALEEHRNLWLAIWKSTGAPGDGLELFQGVSDSYDSVGAIGINSKVAKLYKLLGCELGVLKQYYLLNPAVADFKIAKIVSRPAVESSSADAVCEQLTTEQMLASGVQAAYYPQKSLTFFLNRYSRHPIYKYLYFGVKNSGSETYSAIAVIRPIEINGTKCLRIVDVLGKLENCDSLSAAFCKVLQDQQAEYVDCLNSGIEEEVFRKHGFATLQPDDPNIIPNYFEPFIQQNVTIQFAIINRTDKNYVIFKGDSDQDRPNAR